MKSQLNRFRNWLSHIFDFSQRFRSESGAGDLGAADQDTDLDHRISDESPAATSTKEQSSLPAKIESSNGSPIVPHVVSSTGRAVNETSFTDPEYVVAHRPVTVSEKHPALSQQPEEKETPVIDAAKKESPTGAPESQDQPKIKVAVEEQLATKPEAKPPVPSEERVLSKPQAPSPAQPKSTGEPEAFVSPASEVSVSPAEVKPTATTEPKAPVSPTQVKPTPTAEQKVPVSPAPAQPTATAEPKAPVSPAQVQPTVTAEPKAPVSPTPVKPTTTVDQKAPISPAPVQPTATAEPKAPVSPAPVKPTTADQKVPISPAPVQPTATAEPKASVSPAPVKPTIADQRVPISPAPVQPTATAEPKAPVTPATVKPTTTADQKVPISPAPVQPTAPADRNARVSLEGSTSKTLPEGAVVTKEKVASEPRPQQTAADLGAVDQKSSRKQTGDTKQLNAQAPEKASKGDKPQRSDNGSATRVAQPVKATTTQGQRKLDKPKTTNVAVAEPPKAPPKTEPEGTNSSVSAIRSARARYAPGASTDQTAQRLARLLISEIKLYNKAEVEGATNNVYDILKDPIDKARKYYGQRLGATVVESMPDYFHDELVRTLCAGDPSRLGPNYKN